MSSDVHDGPSDDVVAGLVGRDARRTAVVGGGVALLAFVTLLRGPVSAVAGLLGATAPPGLGGHELGYLVVVPTSAVVAAASARWNDGVATSVVAVFVPSWAWQYGSFAAAGVVGPGAFDAAGIPALVAVPVGALAYLMGRLGLDVRSEGVNPTVHVLVGDSTVSTLGCLAAATIGVLVAAVAVATDTTWLGAVVPATDGSVVVRVGTTVAWVLIVATFTARGGGLLAAWCVAGVPWLAVEGAVLLLRDGGVDVSGFLGTVAFPGTILALVLGTGGYVLGGGIARLRRDSEVTTPTV